MDNYDILDEETLRLLFDVDESESLDVLNVDFNIIETNTIEENKENRFKPISEEDIDNFLEVNLNKNTKRKTDSDIKLFKSYLESIAEFREVELIPPDELSNYVSSFLLGISKKNGEQYEPTSLLGFVSSIDRYLRSKNYQFSVINSVEFVKCREVLKAKQKQLKSLGKGNRSRASDPLDEEILNQFLTCGTLGDGTPASLIHSMWLMCTIHFGMRTGNEIHNLKWGDVTLKTDENGKYLEYDTERQTKTRSGINPANTRLSKPRAYAITEGNTQRDPLHIYNVYKSKRPDGMCNPDSPFFLSVAQREPRPLQQWFKKQAMGINKIYNIMNDMKKAANIVTDKRITPYSARKHLIQKLNDQGVPSHQIVQISGHKNINSLNSYSKLNPGQSKQISDILSNTGMCDKQIPSSSALLPSNPNACHVSAGPHVPVPMLANNTFTGTVNFHFGQISTHHTEFSQAGYQESTSPPPKRWKRIMSRPLSSSSDSE